jgi:hypothetical protein
LLLQEPKDANWNALEKQLMSAVTQLQPIRGLHAKTTYHLRTVLLFVDDFGYKGEDIPYTDATTDCKLVSK